MKKPLPKASGEKAPPSLLMRISPLILISIIGGIVYSNSFDCSFHLDDYRYIVDNTYIRNIGDIQTIWNMPYLRRFVTFYTFALNYHVHRDAVFGYHLVNLIIHIGASLMAWWLVMLIFATPVMRKQPIARHRRLIALACGLLFVSHPVQTQAVTYIYQRLASLATFFYLASLCFYLKARLAGNIRVSLVHFTISVALMLVGSLAKETTYTLPFAMLLFEFGLMHEGEHFFRKNKKVLLYAAIPLAILLIRPMLYLSRIPMLFMNPRASHLPEDPPLSFAIYLMTQFRVLVTYIRLLFFPVGQNLDYYFPASRSFFEPATFLSFLLLLALFIAAIRLFPKKRLISLGILWFFLTLSIESLIPLQDVIYEHRLYLPMFGFSLFFVGSLYSLLGEKHLNVMIGILVAVIGCFSVLTYQRNLVWKNEYTLWSDVVAKSPNKARPLNNLGNYFYLHGYLQQASIYYQRALAINPGYPEIHNNLGTILFQQGKPQEAMRAFQAAVDIDSTNARTHYNLGYIWYAQGEFDAAIDAYRKAITINPEYSEAYYNLGLACQSRGLLDEAVDAYQHAIGLNPTYIDARYNLGIVFSDQGNGEQAVEQFLTIVTLQPDHMNAHRHLAAAYRRLGREIESLVHAGIADSLRDSSR